MRLGLDQAGSGETLVLVHGVGTNRSIWSAVRPALARERRVIAVDLPGFGSSPPAGDGFDIATVAGALAAGLREAGVEEPFDLLGHSLGGAVAVNLATQYPQRVRRLVLSAPAGLSPRPRALAGLLGLGAAGLVKARRELGLPLIGIRRARRLLLAGAVHDGGELAPSEAAGMLQASRGAMRIRAGVTAAVEADLSGQLAELRTPLGLLWGERDGMVPPRMAEAILSLCPEAPLEIVADAGHVPMIEQPVAYSAAATRVLQGIRSPVGDKKCDGRP